MREYDFYVYILRCGDGSYYTGVTNSHERRFREHQEGRNPTCYTFNRRPVTLVYVAHFEYINDAIAWEKQVKGWSRKKKEALIRREYAGLIPLSKRKAVQERLKQNKRT